MDGILLSAILFPPHSAYVYVYTCTYMGTHCKIAISLLCEQVNGNISEVDSVIGSLISGLKARNIEDCVNMIILSDHGK